MTQPAYSVIKPYIDNGDANTDIAEDVSALTVRPITAKAAREYLVENELWYTTPEGWTGPLQTAYLDPSLPVPAATKKALGLLWSIAFQEAYGDCQTTTQLRVNGAAKSLQNGTRLKKTLDRLDTYPNPTAYLTQAQIDGFFALGGGLLYPAGVSEAEVIAAIAAETARVAEETRQNTILALKAEVENDYINPAVSDGTSTAEQVRAAIKAGL